MILKGGCLEPVDLSLQIDLCNHWGLEVCVCVWGGGGGAGRGGGGGGGIQNTTRVHLTQ